MTYSTQTDIDAAYPRTAKGRRPTYRGDVARKARAGDRLKRTLVVGLGILGAAGLYSAQASDPMLVKSPFEAGRFGDTATPQPAGIGGQVGGLKQLAAPRLGIADRVRLKIYQRDDISGEYAVRDDGTIFVPMLGRFQAAGKSAQDIENQVSDALMIATSAPVNVSADVAQWRPIYILGGVDKPGTYTYTPGMTALHALAVAGGMQRLAGQMTLALDAARESGQYQQNRQRLKQALVRQARLTAERTGGNTFELPGRITEIATPDEIKPIAESELRILKQRLEVRERNATAASREVKALDAELQALEVQRKIINERTKLLGSDLDEIRGIATRGLATRQRVRGVERDASDAQIQAPLVLANISRVQRSIEQVQRSLDSKNAEVELELDQQLAATNSEIESLELSMRQSRVMIGQIVGGQFDAMHRGGEAPIRYEIVRAVDGRMQTIAAEEGTQLMPGDVVRVANPVVTEGGSAEQAASRMQEMSSVGKAAFRPSER